MDIPRPYYAERLFKTPNSSVSRYLTFRATKTDRDHIAIGAKGNDFAMLLDILKRPSTRNNYTAISDSSHNDPPIKYTGRLEVRKIFVLKMP